MSCNRFIEIWDTASGPLRRFNPQARLVAGFGVFVACLIPASDTLAGFSFVAFTVGIWLLVTRPSLKMLGRLSLFGLMMFAPFFLLTPWVETASRSLPIWERFLQWEALAIPFRMFVTGFASLLICTATASLLTLAQCYEALARLPLPTPVVLLVTQILQQTELLYAESVRVSQVLALRGATSGLRTGLLLIRHAPSAWLHGMLNKAERVSLAMDLRGYGSVLPQFEQCIMRRRDRMVVGLAFVWPMLAVVIRLGGMS